MRTNNVLIDTSIVLDGVENVTTIDKDSNIFVTDVVLRELDGNKGAEGSKGYNAREFFRQMNNHEFTKRDTLPLTGKAVANNDTLTEGSIDSGAHIFTLSRKWYRAKDINDSKIIEIANDYDLTLNTLDQAQCARAKAHGGKAKVYNKEGYKMLQKTNFSVEPNIKAGLAIAFSIMLGLPIYVISGFSNIVAIIIGLILIPSVLYFTIGDNSSVSFKNEDIDPSKLNEDKLLKPIKESTNIYPLGEGITATNNLATYQKEELGMYVGAPSTTF